MHSGRLKTAASSLWFLPLRGRVYVSFLVSGLALLSDLVKQIWQPWHSDVSKADSESTLLTATSLVLLTLATLPLKLFFLGANSHTWESSRSLTEKHRREREVLISQPITSINWQLCELATLGHSVKWHH